MSCFLEAVFGFRKQNCYERSAFLNASKYCGSVLKNDFVVLVVLVLVLVADELLSNFQRI